MTDINRRRKKRKKTQKRTSIFFKGIVKLMFTIIITLGCMIALKQNKSFYHWFYQNVYEKNINFAVINKTYKKYFGSSFPLENLFKEQNQTVFQETLVYEEANLYLDGVKLKVKENYMIPILDMGMVVFIGEKEGYGNTVIIEQSDGIEVWYGNVKQTTVSLYDLKEKGEYLGESNSDEIYLVFKKDGKVLDYKDYI